jgi:hypothetical protein
MVLIHRHRGEAALPEMVGLLVCQVDAFGMEPIYFAKPCPKTVGMRRNRNHMHMIRHHDHMSVWD